jgi:hypothetical protein
MGITGNCAKFLLYAKKFGVSYKTTMMLGRQQLLIAEGDALNLAANHGIELTNIKYNAYSEPFFHILGAENVDSMDHSGFEKATVIHDLNKPLPFNLNSKYSTVFDGGTLEHVFNFPQAIKSCMDMVKVGGHFISITPANNYCGHGFYQFSPELFFSLFNAQHGFRIALIAIFVELPGTQEATWYKVSNPRDVKQRVILSNPYPTTLMVLAEKIAESTDIRLEPFQSDYAHVWAVHDSMNEDKRIVNEGLWIHFYRKLTPEFIKRIVRRIVNRKINKIENVEGLGVVNPHFFTKIEF